MYGDDGVCRFVGWRGISAEYRAAVEGHCPWARGAMEAATILVEDVAADPAVAAFREVLGREGVRTLAFVPVTTDEGVAGKLMLYGREPGTLTAEHLAAARSAG